MNKNLITKCPDCDSNNIERHIAYHCMDCNEIYYQPYMETWTSVKDRLPIEPIDYLVFVEYGNPREAGMDKWYEIALYDTELKEWFFDSCVVDNSIVTHWLPLPEQPEANLVNNR